MVILDATAGNRVMWGGRKAPYTVYIDKEIGLAVAPDVFADNRFCPFRDAVFETVIYDPPSYVGAPPWMINPLGVSAGHIKRGNDGTFFGSFSSKIEMLTSINRAQREFQRISRRLCLKWVERLRTHVTLWQILPLFRDWKIVQKKEMRKGKTATYWVTFTIGGAM